MNLTNDIPLPVRFNPIKHHRNFIANMLRHIPSDAMFSIMEPLCNNYIDIYTGDFTPEDIGYGIIQRLKSIKALKHDEFKYWLSFSSGYGQIILSDGSEWVLRESGESARYVHIHPSRKGLFTIRFKGSTLKTIYSLKLAAESGNKTLTLEEVNKVRAKIALSPVKNLVHGKGIVKCFEEFFK